MRLLTTFGLTLILFCRFAGSSGAAECPTISGTHTKPQLSGHIADDSRALGLIWRSGADQDSQTREWKLNYGVCNDGASPLVVDWPKAGLSNDAYTPLLPGDSIRSEFPVGVDDPVVDGALLRYGKYTSAEAQTRIYQSAQNGSKKEAKLESRFGRRFALLTGSVNAARPTSASIEGFVTASPDFKKGGYTLTAFAKTSEPLKISFAIVSKQNELLVSAFKESGVGAGQFPVAKLAPDTQIERLKGAMLVPIAFSNGKPVSTFVRSKLDGVEQATLILIVEGRIGLVTKIALYR